MSSLPEVTGSDVLGSLILWTKSANSIKFSDSDRLSHVEPVVTFGHIVRRVKRPEATSILKSEPSSGKNMPVERSGMPRDPSAHSKWRDRTPWSSPVSLTFVKNCRIETLQRRLEPNMASLCRCIETRTAQHVPTKSAMKLKGFFGLETEKKDVSLNDTAHATWASYQIYASASPWHLLLAGFEYTCQSSKLHRYINSTKPLKTDGPNAGRCKKLKSQKIPNGLKRPKHSCKHNFKQFKRQAPQILMKNFSPPATVATSHEFTTIYRSSVSTQHLHNAWCATALHPGWKQNNTLRDSSNNWNRWNHFESEYPSWMSWVLTFNGLKWLGADLTGPFAHFRVLAGLCPGLPSRPWISFRKRNWKVLKIAQIMKSFWVMKSWDTKSWDAQRTFLKNIDSLILEPPVHLSVWIMRFSVGLGSIDSGPGSWKRIVADLIARDSHDFLMTILLITDPYGTSCLTWLSPRSLRRLPLIDQTTRVPHAKSCEMMQKWCKLWSRRVFDFQIKLLGAAQHKAGTLADTQQGDVDPLPGDGRTRHRLCTRCTQAPLCTLPPRKPAQTASLPSALNGQKQRPRRKANLTWHKRNGSR